MELRHTGGGWDYRVEKEVDMNARGITSSNILTPEPATRALASARFVASSLDP
jgi:hypothetical protein